MSMFCLCSGLHECFICLGPAPSQEPKVSTSNILVHMHSYICTFSYVLLDICYVCTIHVLILTGVRGCYFVQFSSDGHNSFMLKIQLISRAFQCSGAELTSPRKEQPLKNTILDPFPISRLLLIQTSLIRNLNNLNRDSNDIH